MLLITACTAEPGDASDAGPPDADPPDGAVELDAGPDAEPIDDVSEGARLFLMPHEDGNTFACNTCHALTEPAGDGFARAGHPLGDAVQRPTFKNGQLDDILDAANSCRTEWMLAPAFDADDPRWIALLDHLTEAAPDAPAEPLTFEIVPPPADATGGEAAAGQAFFNGACALCHGQDAVGTEQAPPLVGAFLDADYIAQRIRTSGLRDSETYDGLTGGRMPFWAADRIDDDTLRDVVAFVLGNDPMDDPDGPMLPDDLERDCPSTHPRVGATGTFRDLFHDVGGTATVVDDCTIEISDFSFDGTGVNVQFYGGQAGDYRGGFSMSPDIRRAGGYDGETLFVQLPEGQTLDDLDGISVWCVPVGVNFGDAVFE